MDKERSIDHQLRATWQAVAKMYNEQASRHESTMSMAFVLLNIDKKKGTPSTALGPSMGMEPTSLSRTLKSMEEKGLIIREKNPNDGRGVLIKLTNEGWQKRELSKGYVYRFNDVVRQNLSSSDLNSFFKVMSVINKLIGEKNIYNETINKQAV